LPNYCNQRARIRRGLRVALILLLWRTRRGWRKSVEIRTDALRHRDQPPHQDCDRQSQSHLCSGARGTVRAGDCWRPRASAARRGRENSRDADADQAAAAPSQAGHRRSLRQGKSFAGTRVAPEWGLVCFFFFIFNSATW